MDLIRNILSNLFWGLLAGIWIWGFFALVFIYIYYWIAEKLGIKHRGTDIWWNDNPYDLNQPKRTFKNMPIPHKIVLFIWIFMTANQVYNEFTNTGFFLWKFG
jgi:hypothetical protein